MTRFEQLTQMLQHGTPQEKQYASEELDKQFMEDAAKNIPALQHPKLIPGGLAVDDRGICWFVNDFHFEGIQRFYVLANHQVGFVRAWHGHKRESKAVYVASGTAVIGLVKIDQWEHPARTPALGDWERHVLSARQPGILLVPGGYANGIMALEPNTLVFEFSDMRMNETKGDDFRWAADYFAFPWNAKER